MPERARIGFLIVEGCVLPKEVRSGEEGLGPVAISLEIAVPFFPLRVSGDQPLRPSQPVQNAKEEGGTKFQSLRPRRFLTYTSVRGSHTLIRIISEEQ